MLALFFVNPSMAQSGIEIYTANTKTPIVSVSVDAGYTVIGREDKWNIIRFNQPTVPVWVSTDYVRIDENDTVSVLADKLNARMLPSLDAPVVSQISTGFRTDAIEIQKDFVKILAPTYFQYALDAQQKAPSLSEAAVPIPSENDKRQSGATGWVVIPKGQNVDVPAGSEDNRTLQSSQTEAAPMSSVEPERSGFLVQPSVQSSLGGERENAVGVSQPVSPIVERMSIEQYRLASGDSIAVTVFGESDLNVPSTRIPQSGVITFPLIGALEVVGKTTQEVEASLISAFSQGYVKNPTLRVTISGYRPVFIKGAVRSIGSFTYTEGLTVAQALFLAGGTNRTAKPNGVSIERDGRVVHQGLSLNSNLPVASGDILTVDEEIGFSEEGQLLYVYLHGEVNRPGEYQYRPGLTVEKAVVLAGGFTLRASKRKVSVSRQIDDQEVPEIMKKVPLYLPVMPGDIISVGASWF